METTDSRARQQGAQNPNPTDRPTMADFTAHLAEAVRDYGTVTNRNGFMLDDETATQTLCSLADLADLAAYVNPRHLAALMAVVNQYAVTAAHIDTQGKANAAHAALSGLLMEHLTLTNLRQQLDAIGAASARWQHKADEYHRAEYAQMMEAKHAEEDTPRTHTPQVIRFTDEDAQNPDTATPAQRLENALNEARKARATAIVLEEKATTAAKAAGVTLTSINGILAIKPDTESHEPEPETLNTPER